MKTYVTSLGVLLTLSAAALAQQAGYPQDPLGIDSLRSQVMSRHFGPAGAPDLRFDAVPLPKTGKPDLVDQIWSEWGVAVAPVPELLPIHCPMLKPDTGLLIEEIRPDSPADRAGLLAGQILLGTQNEWFATPHDLPRLLEPQTVTVLVAGRLREVDVQPDRTPLSAAKPKAGFRSAPSPGLAFSDHSGGASQAISLACANGIFDIEASYATTEGQQKVHLSGTRRQIEKSMANLPPSLQKTIKHRLEMVSPLQ